jgi:uncharacterized Zn finger protein (UPF0148 family)
MECGTVLYADADGEFFCAYCDGEDDPEMDFECWLDDAESSFNNWNDNDRP